MQQYTLDRSDLFGLSNLTHALSGCLGSAFAITLLFPLETARTRLQVDDSRRSENSFRVIYSLAVEEGLSSLYRGWRSLVISLSVTNFVYFYVFHGLKLCLDQNDQSSYMDLMFGILAGVAAVLVSNPLWVVNMKLKLQGANMKTKHFKQSFYSGIVDGIFQIAAHEGPLALWSGVYSSLLLATNPALNFMIYEGLKRNTIHQLNTLQLSGSALYFTYGAVSKLIATVITYPLQLAQARIRAGVSVSGSSFTLRSVTLWYRGMESKLIQTVLTSAIMQLIYEHLLRVIGKLLLQSTDEHTEL